MAQRRSGSRGAAAWLVPLLTFVAGLVLGGFLLWLFNGDDTSSSVQADGTEAPASPSADGASPSSAASPEVVVRVPASCLDVADQADRAAEVFDGALEAVRDFDARRLEEIVEEVQDLQPSIQEQAQQCRDQAEQARTDGDVVVEGESFSPTP